MIRNCHYVYNLLAINFSRIQYQRRLINSINMSATTQLSEIVKKLNEFAPVNLAEEWDNVGLLIEPSTQRPIENIFLTNDLTEKVLNEAIEKQTDLIIAYHPPIFSGLKRITQSTWKERIVGKCLENRIALYSPHTSWDSVRGGVTDWLLKSLPHTNSKVILPAKDTGNGADVGAGRIADLAKPLTLAQSIESVKQHTGIRNVQVGLGVNRSLLDQINTFAVCAGSGSSVLKGVNADLYITGEMSHHDVLEANHNDVNVILCNHSNSERGYLLEFKEILHKLLNDQRIQINISAIDADPLSTY